jgi:5-methyltetrahydropteroyltriglutamate--homocysteine methyltransferase
MNGPTMKKTPPFRADQVGSLLRPGYLKEARGQRQRGEIGAGELKAVEDRAIADLVAKQESVGLRSVTDGEFRREIWHLDFLSQLDGVITKPNPGVKFTGSEEQPKIAAVTGKVRCSRPVMVDHFTFLKSLVSRTPKFTIPSPSMLHLRGGRDAISKEVYPDLEAFWADVAEAYRQAIAHFAAAGCTYLQLDDVSFAYLCDERIQAQFREKGEDPAETAHTYANTINQALAHRPPGMSVTMHTCRGNFRSAWVAEGGYEAVAEAMFSAGVDGFFMEFDSERAGGFEPLRALPKGKQVVLGLVTTKVGTLEDKDALKRRVDEAARYVPLENLCLSPQCGFSSDHHGNQLSEDEQWRKLALIVEVANEVWGDS